MKHLKGRMEEARDEFYRIEGIEDSWPFGGLILCIMF